jgi:choline kinase
VNDLRRPHPSHVVILAAGRGSRLGALGDTTPKWLLEVGGRTLADRQLEGIAAAGDAVASVRVVAGHASEVIEAELARRADDVRVLHNPEWAERNNWWSLLLALRELPADGPVAVLNADLLAAPEQIASFLRDAAAGGADGLLVVDCDKDLTDESMKVALDGDLVAGIGKTGLDTPAGEYIGLLRASGPALRTLRAALESFVHQPELAAEWYEGAIDMTVVAGARWGIWPMPAGGWVEIDDDADLRQARALVTG